MKTLHTLTALICLLILGCSPKEDTPIPSFRITFESNGGSAISTQTIEDGNKATEPSTPPTKTGEVFGGWFTEAGLTNAFDFDTPITQNITLYAKWTEQAPNTFTLTFESNGGTAISTQTIEDGNKATEPSTPPTKTGEVFGGWFTETALTNAFDFDTPITQSTILYAKWTPKAPTTFTVTFESNGGTAISTQTIEDGNKATEPSTPPTKTGEVFGGWFTETALTNAFDFETAVITQNITLYAKWMTEETFNIPDANFKTALKNLIPNAFNENDELITNHTDVSTLTEISCSGKNIASLEGIQFFTALENLTCSDNQLTNLDLSNNTALKKLNCVDNQLTSLDFSNNIDLIILECSTNRLTSLDISNNINLEILVSPVNQLNSLDVSNNTSLISLFLTNNQLTTLDLSNNTTLITLTLTSNPSLTSLDIRGMRKIDGFNTFITFDLDQSLSLIKVHDDFKNYPSGLKTNRGDDLKIEVYTADAGSTNYTKTCSDYDPNSETCTTP